MSIAQEIIDATGFHEMRQACHHAATRKTYHCLENKVEYRFPDGSGVMFHQSGYYEKCLTLRPEAIEFV